LLEWSADSTNWTAVKTSLIEKNESSYTDIEKLRVGKVYYRISARADKNQSNYSYAKSICLTPATPGTITGNTNLPQNSQGIVYSVVPVNGALSYLWTVPAGATIVSGQGTISLTINFGTNSGNVTVQAINSCGNSLPASIAKRIENYCPQETSPTSLEMSLIILG
jgi:hypothetical protein